MKEINKKEVISQAEHLDEQPIHIKIINLMFSLCYTIGLIYVVFFARRRRHLFAHDINYFPFKNIFANSWGSSHDQVNYYDNLVGNIILFLPVPFIISFYFKLIHGRVIILLSIFLSFTIEILQYFFEVGVADIDDIILNTVGAFTGLWVCRSIGLLKCK